MPPQAQALRPENTTQALLLSLLREDGARSRAELSDAVALSRGKVAAELDRLRDLGLIEDAGPAASRGGRRSSLVRLSSRLRFLGIDIGATSIDVAVTDGQLTVLAHVCEQVDVRSGPDVVLGEVLRLTDRLRAQGHLPRLDAAGVGVPGPVRQPDGVPVSPPIMPGWDRYPVREVLGGKLGCPVLVDNDVNIMALGERHAGTARGIDDFLFVKIGTGIGCGIVLDGRVHHGVTGSAGDIGHIRVEEFGPTCACGNTGCLEAFFGGAALVRDATAAARAGRSPLLADRLAQAGALSPEDVGIAAAGGDQVATGMIRDGGRRLGYVLASLVSFFNPALIVIGGGVSHLGHALLAEVRAVVYRRSAPLATGNLPIVLSELGDSAGVVGGAWLASEAVYTLR